MVQELKLAGACWGNRKVRGRGAQTEPRARNRDKGPAIVDLAAASQQ